MTGQAEQWRLIENPQDGTSPEWARWRVVGGEGRETRLIGLFMHQTDAENAANDHNAVAKMRLAHRREPSR